MNLEARYYRNFATPDGPPGYVTERLTLDPAATALLLLDVYSGIQDGEDIEGVSGAMGDLWRQAVSRIAAALEAARACGLPVIYAVNSAPRIALKRSEFGAHFQRSWGGDFDHAFREGGVDAREYHGGRPGPLTFPTELEPRPGEYYIRKHVYSAFFDTRLDSLLRHLSIRALVIAGFWADVCMLATALDALYRNYRVIWLRDGTLAGEEAGREAELQQTQHMLRWFENVVGYTVTAAEFAVACARLREEEKQPWPR
jgi:nicotinamidase-related amidase